jgi:oligopeptide transport system substrate-binding protein
LVGRGWFIVVMLIGGLAAVGMAVHGSRLPPADFTFFNESVIKSIEPAAIAGHPEGRMAWALFEGLTRPRADDVRAEPGDAERWDVSEGRRLYAFHLRENDRWSNGDLVTAGDFLYSIRRLLDPLTGAEYSYQAWYLAGAKCYTYGARGIKPGDSVEVELHPPADVPNTTRGEVLVGQLERIDDQGGSSSQSSRSREFVVRTGGRARRFCTAGVGDRLPVGVEPCRQVLLDFREVAMRAVDDRTLEIRKIPRPIFSSCWRFSPSCRSTAAASSATAHRHGKGRRTSFPTAHFHERSAAFAIAFNW